MDDTRDISLTAQCAPAGAGDGRNLIVTVGIDQYRHWRPLTNAVSDADGARQLFQQLGFEEAAPPLRNADATGAALHALVVDELAALGSDDSLVVFYAGHGGSRTQDRGGRPIKTGYLIPSDADRDRASTWIELEGWLREVSRLPPRHILVILDSCYSGIALDPVVKWRDDEALHAAPFETLQARCSRRVITSALDDEQAVDAGPVAGHSLFTGCLIEALTMGITGLRGMTTGAELAVWVRQRVRTYPRARQTPDFGTFDGHDRGELVIPLLGGDRERARIEGPRQDPDPEPLDAASRPARRLARAVALLARLRQEGEWLLIVGPLLAVAVSSLLVKAC